MAEQRKKSGAASQETKNTCKTQERTQVTEVLAGDGSADASRSAETEQQQGDTAQPPDSGPCSKAVESL